MICTSGPHDHSFEEQHSSPCVAIVMSGSFQYRSTAGRVLMVPGSLLVGNSGQPFECSHEHGVGDRCLSFHYDEDYFEDAVYGAAAPHSRLRFQAARIPPVRELASLVARACTAMKGSKEAPWEELGLELAGRALRFGDGSFGTPSAAPPASEARISRITRMIEHEPNARHQLSALAKEARLSRYHFLRTFAQLTGLTPHQYIVRARLRQAAIRLALDLTRVVDIALDCGFGDVSNFNHAFRTEFGVSPRRYRRAAWKVRGTKAPA